MFRPLSHSHRRPQRRGTSFILIVVVMLSLFSAVGTAYALFAMREARLALARKDEQGGGSAPQLRAPDPTDTLNRFFSALIFDHGDSDTDVTNALRGHSLARSKYGRDVSLFNAGTPPTTPYNGVGLFDETITGIGQRISMINYTAMTIGGNTFLLDPEYMGTRPLNGTALKQFNEDLATRIYVSKAAGYSYPDLKDFFLGAYDPATGEVLVPSFYRPWLVPGGLASTSAFWTDPKNKLKILRPWPSDHPNFPKVPKNADGSYTGDVQNLPGGIGAAKMDSLWMDIGLPVVTLPGGRKVKPLVAPLILPLNGLLNASVHGNTFFGGTHSSYHGFGPYEVNLGAVLGGDANAIVTERGALQQRNNQPNRRFTMVPNYSPLAWNNTAVTAPPPYTPTTPANPLAGVPGFDLTQFQNANFVDANHPSLFNPTEWPDKRGLPGRIFPLTDIKRLFLRYANTPDWYTQSDLASLAPSLRDSVGFTLATGKATPANYGYRRDPNHANRGLFTPRSFDLDRPKLTPLFLNRDTGVLTMADGALKATLTPPQYPSPTTLTATNTDFTSANQWSLKLDLGAVDLNRPLRDYRDLNAAPNTPTPQPLSASNIANAANADFDRRKLAHDIFVRLAVTTGAGLNIKSPAAEYPNYVYDVQVASTSNEYRALRYLAQLAVNIVDYIDNDDISTVFVWNPATPPPLPADQNPNTNTANFTDAATISDRVVFGVEKPRLMINEIYSEITNDPASPAPDGTTPLPADAQAHVRFWLELLNPTAPLGANSPLGTGGVSLTAYRIEIGRASLATDPANPYWSNPANTTGSFDRDSTKKPDIVFTPPASAPAVEPNNGEYNPAGDPAKGVVVIGPQLTADAMKPEEFIPDTTAAPWNKAVLAPVTAPTASPSSNNMVYSLTMPAAADLAGVQFKRHVVLLRRLANPYKPFDPADTTNPHITVDMMDYVPSFDAVYRAATQTTARGPRPAESVEAAKEFDPKTERFSVGKVQPLAGQAAPFDTTYPKAGAGEYNRYAAFPKSMVQRQAPTMSVAMQPLHTFGQHNGKGAAPDSAAFTAGATATLSDTLMAPFDWLVHMDRPLVNQLELLQVRDTPPHRLTQQFIVESATTPGVSYDNGYVSWIDGGFARALEYLTVRPYIAGVGHGGRVPGRINVNAIPDQRVLAGLMDPQGGNVFDSTFVTNTAWNTWMNTRTLVETKTLADPMKQVLRTTAPIQTNFEGGTTPNRPFLPLGAPVAAAGGGTFAYGGGAGTDLSNDLTILRRQAATGTTPISPYLFTNQTNKAGTVTYPASQPDGPSYYRAEPARKIFNNITTVNSQYVVFLTIGYFEADTASVVTLAPGITVPQLGAEAFISVPGDMRQKYIAVIDMSNMALDPASNTVAAPPAGSTDPWQPVFTSLEATAYGNGTSNTPVQPGTSTAVPLSVAYSRADATNVYIAADGVEVPITTGSKLVIGYGAEQQVVTVSGIAGPGQISVTADSGVFRTAWGGTVVSNVRSGYPGPQADFSYTAPTYKPVIPYVERVRQ